MGDIVSSTYTFKKKVTLADIQSYISRNSNFKQVERSQFLSPTKYLINYGYYCYWKQTLLGDKKYLRFQTIFMFIDEHNMTISTEYGFVGSGASKWQASAMNKDFIGMLKIIETNKKEESPKTNETPVSAMTFSSAADDLLKAKQLLDAGAISQEEYNQLKDKFLKTALNS